MRFKILLLFVSVIVLLCGGWLYILSSGAAEQYQQTFNSFGVTPPQITTVLFSSLSNWWAILLAIAVISYIPLLASKDKWQYTSVLTSLACLLTLVGVVYVPILTMGSII